MADHSIPISQIKFDLPAHIDRTARSWLRFILEGKIIVADAAGLLTFDNSPSPRPRQMFFQGSL